MSRRYNTRYRNLDNLQFLTGKKPTDRTDRDFSFNSEIFVHTTERRPPVQISVHPSIGNIGLQRTLVPVVDNIPPVEISPSIENLPTPEKDKSDTLPQENPSETMLENIQHSEPKKNYKYNKQKKNTYFQKYSAHSFYNKRKRQNKYKKRKNAWMSKQKTRYHWQNPQYQDSKNESDEIPEVEDTVSNNQTEEIEFEEVEVASLDGTECQEIPVSFRKHKVKYLTYKKKKFFRPKIFMFSKEKTVVNCVNVPKISTVVDSDKTNIDNEKDTDTITHETNVSPDSIESCKFKLCMEENIPAFFQGKSVIQKILENWQSHLIGLEYVIEVRNDDDDNLVLNYYCMLCQEKLDISEDLFIHINQKKHIVKFMENQFPSFGFDPENIPTDVMYLQKCCEEIHKAYGYYFMCISKSTYFNDNKSKIEEIVNNFSHYKEGNVKIDVDKIKLDFESSVLNEVNVVLNTIIDDIVNQENNKAEGKEACLHDDKNVKSTKIMIKKKFSSLSATDLARLKDRNSISAFIKSKYKNSKFHKTRRDVSYIRKNTTTLPSAKEECVDSSTKDVDEEKSQHKSTIHSKYCPKRILGTEKSRVMKKHGFSSKTVRNDSENKSNNLSVSDKETAPFTEQNDKLQPKNNSSTSNKNESLRGDPNKKQSLQDDSIKNQNLKGDSKNQNFKGDSSRDQSLRRDSSKNRSLKSDSSRSQNLKGDSNRHQSLKDDSNRNQNLKSDTSKKESLKGDSTRSHSLKGDSSRNHSSKSDSKVSEESRENRVKKTKESSSENSSNAKSKRVSRSPEKKSSRSPVRRIVKYSNSSVKQHSPSPSKHLRSPTRKKSKSPVRKRSKSPIGRRSRSPVRRQFRSPIRRRSKSPTRKRSRSPLRRRSKSPLQRRSRSPLQRRSRSPLQRRSRSPLRRRSRSPLRRRSRSPLRRRSRSPLRRRSRSPLRRRSKSPLRRNSRSPFRRNSRSPFRRNSRSPFRRNSRSPLRRISRSPFRRNSRSPFRRQSRSPLRRRSRSPFRRQARSPNRQNSKSPDRWRVSITSRHSRSPISRLSSSQRSPERLYSKTIYKSSSPFSKYIENRLRGSRSPRRASPSKRYSKSPDLKRSYHSARDMHSGDNVQLSKMGSRATKESGNLLSKHSRDEIKNPSKSYSSNVHIPGIKQFDLDPVSDEDESVYFNTLDKNKRIVDIKQSSSKTILAELLQRFSKGNIQNSDPMLHTLMQFMEAHSDEIQDLMQGQQNTSSQVKQGLSVQEKSAFLQQYLLSSLAGNTDQPGGTNVAPLSQPQPGGSNIFPLQTQPVFGMDQSFGISGVRKEIHPLPNPRYGDFPINVSVPPPQFHNFQIQQNLPKPKVNPELMFSDLKAKVHKLFGDKDISQQDKNKQAGLPFFVTEPDPEKWDLNHPNAPKFPASVGPKSVFHPQGNIDFRGGPDISMVKESVPPMLKDGPSPFFNRENPLPPHSMPMTPRDKFGFHDNMQGPPKGNFYPQPDNRGPAGFNYNPNIHRGMNDVKVSLAQRLASVLVKVGMTDVPAPLLQEMLMKIGAFSSCPPQDITETEILSILERLGYLS